MFTGFTNPFGAVRLLGGPVALAYAVQGVAALLATALVFIAWRWRLSLPIRAAVLAAATLVAAPVAIFYDLMLGTIAACWLVRDQGQPISPAEKTFFAAIVLLLLDVRDLGEAYRVRSAPCGGWGCLATGPSPAFREWGQGAPAWAARWWGKRYATCPSSLLGCVAVRLGDQLHQVPVRVVEIDAAAAVTV